MLTSASPGHLEATHCACPAQRHPAMDRTCWQPAPGSLSPSLSKVCTAGPHGSRTSRDSGMLFKGLEKRLPCSKHLRTFQAKMQLSKQSALPVWVLYSLFRYCVFAFQQVRSHLTALLTESAGLIPSLHLCVLLPPRGEYDTRNSTSWLHYRIN